jgi:hypothetical protein
LCAYLSRAIHAIIGLSARVEETVMAGKNKGGREAKKPKANAKKTKGAAPTTIPIVESMNKTGRPKK